MEALNTGVFFDHTIDFIEANVQIARNYKDAFEKSGVKNIVHLSSIGAHMSEGNGILKFHYNVEKILNELPSEYPTAYSRKTDRESKGKIIHYSIVGQ